MMPPHLRLIVAMLASFIGAYGLNVSPLAAGSMGGTLTIRPFSDITADGPHVSHINPTHATLDFITTIPVACAVVYGIDDSFGQIAVDPAMAGAAIMEHLAIMGNLEPNTVYQYRLQGSDADGTLYVSEVFTFATPGQVSQDVNLAALEAGAAVVEVSSNWANGTHDSSFGANKAIDNNENSAWASNGDGDGAFVTVQLMRPGLVHAIAVWSREMSDGTSRVIDFTVTSNTGENFRFTLPDAAQSYRFDTPFMQPVSTLRFDVDASTGGNVGLRDLDALAAP